MVYSYTKRSISAVLIPSRIFSSTQSNTAVFNSPLFLIPSICSGNLMSFREGTSLPFFPNTSLFYQLLSHEDFIRFAKDRGKTINIALVGNPNCGKTSMFNFASGAYEHVGNYSGVTVDAKEEVFTQDEYTFKIIDLPGTYSLSTYILEELYVRKYLKED